MKLIVIRDENADFFKSYWKKWYELGRGRQQLRLEERQQALHDLMEVYLGEDGSLEELKREFPSMADIADFEERYNPRKDEGE